MPERARAGPPVFRGTRPGAIGATPLWGLGPRPPPADNHFGERSPPPQMGTPQDGRATLAPLRRLPVLRRAPRKRGGRRPLRPPAVRLKDTRSPPSAVGPGVVAGFLEQDQGTVELGRPPQHRLEVGRGQHGDVDGEATKLPRRRAAVPSRGPLRGRRGRGDGADRSTRPRPPAPPPRGGNRKEEGGATPRRLQHAPLVKRRPRGALRRHPQGTSRVCTPGSWPCRPPGWPGRRPASACDAPHGASGCRPVVSRHARHGWPSETACRGRGAAP